MILVFRIEGEKIRYRYIYIYIRSRNSDNFRIELFEKYLGFWKYDFNIYFFLVSFILDKMLVDGSDLFE